MASLYKACRSAIIANESGTYNVGGYDIGLELYHQSNIDDDFQYGDVTFGDEDESKIVLVSDDTITIPEGYTLTPDSPKKSLVIYCNHLVNNGTISMYQKAPNVLPHNYYIIEGSIIGSNRNVIIPAYANNAATKNYASSYTSDCRVGVDGNNGIDRNCGSGGTGTTAENVNKTATSGSGYAFGGGAGSAGAYNAQPLSVDSEYPMRGSDFVQDADMVMGYGGVGNPTGAYIWNPKMPSRYNVKNGFGCGGRIIIFCSTFTNNGEINVDGSASPTTPVSTYGVDYYNKRIIAGGASGAGAVDIFYKNLVTEGTISATGGVANKVSYTTPGKGGDGSITFTQWSYDKIIKEERKMFTKDNWSYLFTNYSQRLREDVI